MTVRMIVTFWALALLTALSGAEAQPTLTTGPDKVGPSPECPTGYRPCGPGCCPA